MCVYVCVCVCVCFRCSKVANKSRNQLCLVWLVSTMWMQCEGSASTHILLANGFTILPRFLSLTLFFYIVGILFSILTKLKISAIKHIKTSYVEPFEGFYECISMLPFQNCKNINSVSLLLP